MRENLIPNSSFKLDASTWAATSSASISRVTTDGFFGLTCLEVTKAASDNSGAYLDTPIISVVAGQIYAVSAYVKVPDTDEIANLRLRVKWYESDAVRTQVGSTEYGLTATLDYQDGWLRLGDTFTAPAGSGALEIAIVQETAGTAGQRFLVDAVLVEASASINQYIEDYTQAEENAKVRATLTKMPEPYLTGMQLNADVQINGLILNTIDEAGVVWVCTDIDGWWTLPDPEIQDLPRGLGDGSYDVRGRYTARQLELTGVFLTPDPSKVSAARAKLVEAVNLVRKNGWLIVDEDPIKASRVRLSGRPVINTVNARGRTEFSIGLRAADPIKYEWIQENQDGMEIVEVAVGESITIPNAGNTSVTAIFQITGPATAGAYVYNDTDSTLMTLLSNLNGPNHRIGDISQIERADNIATVVFSGDTPVAVGDLINVVSLVDTTFNGTNLPVLDTYKSGDDTVVVYSNTGDDETATSVSAGIVQRSEPDVLELNTYDREVAYNGFVSGSRSKVETLIDWIVLQPGDNVIGLSDPGYTITTAALTSNVATITTSTAHNLAIGESITITGATNSAFNGTYDVASTPTTTTFTFSKTNIDISSAASSGAIARNDGLLTVYYRSGWIG